MHACLNHLTSIVQSRSACHMAEGPGVAWLLCCMADGPPCVAWPKANPVTPLPSLQGTFDLPWPFPPPLPSLQGTAYVLPAYGVFVCTECSGKQ